MQRGNSEANINLRLLFLLNYPYTGGETVSTGLVRAMSCRWSANLLKNSTIITANNNAELALAA